MRERKLFLLICAVCVFSAVCSHNILADSAPKKELFFGPIVSSLEGTGILASKTQGGGLLKATADGSGKTETIHFSLETAQTSLKTVRGKDYVKIDGLKPSGSPGEPQLPFKSFVISLPLNSKVSGVNVSGISYRPILNKLEIVPMPMPVGSAGANGTVKKDGEETKGPLDIQKAQTVSETKGYTKCKTCDSDTFLPGNLVFYGTGKSNNTQLVFIKFFPMQYIPKSGRAILITDADITVNYQVADSNQKTE
ncbi:MAG: hypothetical protein PHW62_02175 [Candidatus Ratteibacteria bacterium]|nr:hypothetical protein [Candidatus Ratteibacteria bacterium]